MFCINWIEHVWNINHGIQIVPWFAWRIINVVGLFRTIEIMLSSKTSNIILLPSLTMLCICTLGYITKGLTCFSTAIIRLVLINQCKRNRRIIKNQCITNWFDKVHIYQFYLQDNKGNIIQTSTNSWGIVLFCLQRYWRFGK